MIDRSTYAKNPPRVVLVIGDTAVGHSSLGHDRVESGVSDGAPTAVSPSYERVDGSIPAVLFLNRLVPLATHVEPHATDGSSDGNDGDNGTSSDSSNIDAAP